MENKKQNKFIVHTIEDTKINYEAIYEKLEAKKKHVKEINLQIIELKNEHGEDCENAKFLEKSVNDLERDIVYLWDVFRGKIRKIVYKTINVPMSVDKAVNYLAFLLNEDPIKNNEDIRCIVGAINNNPGVCDGIKDEKLLSRIKDNLNYIIKKME